MKVFSKAHSLTYCLTVALALAFPAIAQAPQWKSYNVHRLAIKLQEPPVRDQAGSQLLSKMAKRQVTWYNINSNREAISKSPIGSIVHEKYPAKDAPKNSAEFLEEYVLPSVRGGAVDGQVQTRPFPPVVMDYVTKNKSRIKDVTGKFIFYRSIARDGADSQAYLIAIVEGTDAWLLTLTTRPSWALPDHPDYQQIVSAYNNQILAILKSVEITAPQPAPKSSRKTKTPGAG